MLLQFLGVVVPLLAATIPLFRWPTLERRTRRHVALMEELPEGMGKRFREAVEEELRELGHRSEQRLTRNARILEFSFRVAFIAGFYVVAVLAYRQATESDNLLISVGQGALIVFGLFSAGVLLSLLWRAAGNGYERERLWRRAQDEGKRLFLLDGEWLILSDDEYEARRRRDFPAVQSEEATGSDGATPK